MGLSKEARRVIVEKIEGVGEMTTEEAMDFIRPHYDFDVAKAREREIRSMAHRIMRGIRDDTGARKCFNCKSDSGESKYINVEVSESMPDLLDVKRQIDLQYYGLNQSRKKVTRRILQVAGQITLFDKAEF